jgi:hypothetical protein
LVVADEKGNYSAVQVVEAIDELQKYIIARPVQTSAFDETITFVFPKNKEAAQMTINSLITELNKSGYYLTHELRQAINDALDEIESKT